MPPKTKRKIEEMSSSDESSGNKRRRGNSSEPPGPILSLTNEIMIYMMSFLADLDILRLYQVSRRFHELFPEPFLSAASYVPDPKPIMARGHARTPLSAVEHYKGAIESFRMALNIRNEAARYRQAPKIFLYRVSDKETLTATEKKRYVVPGPFWTVEKTAAWILGGSVARLPFVLVTPPNKAKNFVEGNVARRGAVSSPAIYAREIMQLLSLGYRPEFAKPEERPYHMSQRTDVLILRPPTGGAPFPQAMAQEQTRLNWDNTWDRSNKALLVQLHGETVTGADLHRYFRGELEALEAVAALMAMYEEEYDPGMEEIYRRHHREDPDDEMGGGGNTGMVF